MICIKKDCNNQASAKVCEDVLDVNSSENKWVTEEPTYKKVSLYYCKKHFQEVIDVLTTSKN
ncbi:hypothetical protein ELUMI_v1c03850 [Williamsoniiplasma luminosum]|uniref:Uncharacterized protein n=1 Tax=Williamsoniiplasma luminosum TaxID=214888 RepID=A0A2K8NTE8_9MOLU|nr:hypothetical protein [Williamsoniiplasma luminosum]ATZ17110.1 hypothetical protein ELUMI_v1c03850 [Williamsoniiplasma luminosum]AVP49769.1 MAG: hypothetical protein C5T88_04345 [Williamsoniiplasma luminosum]